MVNRTKPWGRSRNLINKAAPTDRQSTSTAKIAALLVSASFVNIPNIPSIAEVLARCSYLERQVVGGVASPDLEGGQVAVLRLHAASVSHVTKVAYSRLGEMYVLYGTKHAPEVPRIPLPRTPVNKPSEFGAPEGSFTRLTPSATSTSCGRLGRALLTDLRSLPPLPAPFRSYG